MKALSILIIVFAVIAFVAMCVREVFKHKKGAEDKSVKIAGWICVGSISIAAICGLIQVIIPLV